MRRHLYIIAAIACMAWACETLPTSPDQIPDTSYRAVTAIGKALEECPSVGHIYSDSCMTIAPGVLQTNLHIQTAEAKVEHIFFLTVDLRLARIKVATPEDAYVPGRLLKPSEMAEASGLDVLAVIGGDAWDSSSGEVCGPIHKGGKILKESFIWSTAIEDQAVSFFGMDAEGCPVIRDSSEYRAVRNTLEECTGSGVIVVKDGCLADGGSFLEYSPYRLPRTCVGYTADGSIMYVFVCDGKRALWSDGMLYEEMGDIMLSLGCSWAASLGNGEYSQMLTKEAPSDILKLRNRTSDGAEYPTADAWMIVPAI